MLWAAWDRRPEDSVNIRPIAAVLLAGILAAGCGFGGTEVERHTAVVSANCLDCHNAAEAIGGLNLESHSLDSVAADAETWEQVIKKLRAGLMPPADGPSLARDQREALVTFIEHKGAKTM